MIKLSLIRFRRRRARLLLGGGLLGLVLLAGIAWVAVTAILARSHLEHLRSELTVVKAQIESGDTAGAAAGLRAAAGNAHQAHSLTSGPAWWVSSELPWVGSPIQTVRGLSAQADYLATHALPEIIDVTSRLKPSSLRTNSDTIDVATLSQAAPTVHAANRNLAAALSRVRALPAHTWLTSADTARTHLLANLSGLSTILQTADDTMQVLPGLLGRTSLQRYFIAFQNPAEARGTGGLAGAFAIVTALHGQVRFEHFESDSNLNGISVALDLGADYTAHYGSDHPFSQYVDSNESPNFPNAAQIWAAMWLKKTGEKVDGAIAIDPVALSYLLKVTGAGKLANGAPVSSENVVALVEKDIYAQFPFNSTVENSARRLYLLNIARAMSARLLTSSASARALLHAAAQAGRQRRLLLWSSDAAAERILASSPLGGIVSDTTQPFSLLSINNGSGGKLDYYLDRRYRWQRTGCGPTSAVTVTITLRNGAPASGLPPYVVAPPDGTALSGAIPAGDLRSLLDYFATAGATLTQATVDGVRSEVSVFSENGHPVFRTIVLTAPGQSHTIVLTLTEPTGTAPVTVIKQPLTRSLTVTTTDRCR